LSLDKNRCKINLNIISCEITENQIKKLFELAGQELKLVRKFSRIIFKIDNSVLCDQPKIYYENHKTHINIELDDLMSITLLNDIFLFSNVYDYIKSFVQRYIIETYIIMTDVNYAISTECVFSFDLVVLNDINLLLDIQKNGYICVKNYFTTLISKVSNPVIYDINKIMFVAGYYCVTMADVRFMSRYNVHFEIGNLKIEDDLFSLPDFMKSYPTKDCTISMYGYDNFIVVPFGMNTYYQKMQYLLSVSHYIDSIPIKYPNITEISAIIYDEDVVKITVNNYTIWTFRNFELYNYHNFTRLIYNEVGKLVPTCSIGSLEYSFLKGLKLSCVKYDEPFKIDLHNKVCMPFKMIYYEDLYGNSCYGLTTESDIIVKKIGIITSELFLSECNITYILDTLCEKNKNEYYNCINIIYKNFLEGKYYFKADPGTFCLRYIFKFLHLLLEGIYNNTLNIKYAVQIISEFGETMYFNNDMSYIISFIEHNTRNNNIYNIKINSVDNKFAHICISQK
jgi:hypothetical protein